mmetsp:Transcript_47914/g.158788  ORF Transcript_47914/g.158788 Transcript_47914/m.158788 type:complete len:218 (+) Transcript_47914:1549-2202(+)
MRPWLVVDQEALAVPLTEHALHRLRGPHVGALLCAADDSVGGAVDGVGMAREEALAEGGDCGEQRHRVVLHKSLNEIPDRTRAGAALSIGSIAEAVQEPSAIAPLGEASPRAPNGARTLPQLLDARPLRVSEPPRNRRARECQLVINLARHLAGIRRPPRDADERHAHRLAALKEVLRGLDVKGVVVGRVWLEWAGTWAEVLNPSHDDHLLRLGHED